MTGIRIILVEPRYPANIGACARAMKTMGLRHLWLVNPRRFPDREATRLATEAADVLENATVVSSLREALDDTVLALATSSRPRAADWPVIPLEEAAGQLLNAARQGPAALVFGPEPSGLTSNDIYQTKGQVQIPTAADCSSLNLAQAVQVAAYEMLRQGARRAADGALEDPPPAPVRALEHFYGRLREALIASGFPRRDPDHLMLSFRRLFNRAAPTEREISMLEGLLRSLTRRRD